MPFQTFRRRIIFASGVLVLSLILLLIVVGMVRENDHDLAAAVFDREMEDFAADLQKQIDMSTEVVESIEGFYNASVKVERDEFREFVKTSLFRHSLIQALEWIPAVADSDRAEYEERARTEGMKGFRFTERKSQGVMQRAGRRPCSRGSIIERI